MIVKVIGAAIIIIACGGLGFRLAAAHRAEEAALLQLIELLEDMLCEFSSKRTPLPLLCRQIAVNRKGCIKRLLLRFSDELENQILPDTERCMAAAVEMTGNVPQITAEHLLDLGRGLGRFDASGMIQCLENISNNCKHSVERLMKDSDTRLRGYKTLGLCAGAALVIVLI